MVKKLRNTTGTAIAVASTGVTLQPATDYTIPTQDYSLWASSDVLTEILSNLSNGNIVVKDDVSTLKPLAGLALLEMRDVTVPIFLSKGGGSNHVHTSYITPSELDSLMMGVVSSIVKTSSDTSTGTAHTHTITFTWNELNGQLVGAVTTDLFHTHPFVAGVQPDPLSHADIKRSTGVYEETVPGFIRLKHDWKIEDGFEVVIVDDSEILLI
jgi:hypothetical protein